MFMSISVSISTSAPTSLSRSFYACIHGYMCEYAMNTLYIYVYVYTHTYMYIFMYVHI